MLLECYPEKKETGLKGGTQTIPKFRTSYQSWYSEAVTCVGQLLPTRRDDFKAYYTPPKTRKSINSENYMISDYLKGLSTSQFGQEITGPTAAISAMEQQSNIVTALQKRFESSLFDIRALVQADLFGDELDAAEELNKKDSIELRGPWQESS